MNKTLPLILVLIAIALVSCGDGATKSTNTSATEAADSDDQHSDGEHAENERHVEVVGVAGVGRRHEQRARHDRCEHVHRHRSVDGIRADHGAPDHGAVPARAERLAELARDAAHVGALAAVDVEGEERPLVSGHLDRVDLHGPCGKLGRLALARHRRLSRYFLT